MADGIRQKLPVELKTYPLNVYSKEQETHTMQFDDILAEMAQYSCTHIVISGGEPLLQAELIDFSSLLLEKGYSLEIETNGTQSPQGYHQSIRFNVSPKLENSYNDLDRRYIPAVLDEFLVADTIFKFVVSSREDLQEVQEIISNHSIPPDRVYLMPEGKTSEELAPRSKWLIELCKEYNYRYSHRLHVELFDKKRGV
jgi:organic radical activating enzyme